MGASNYLVHLIRWPLPHTPIYQTSTLLMKNLLRAGTKEREIDQKKSQENPMAPLVKRVPWLDSGILGSVRVSALRVTPANNVKVVVLTTVTEPSRKISLAWHRKLRVFYGGALVGASFI